MLRISTWLWIVRNSGLLVTVKLSVYIDISTGCSLAADAYAYADKHSLYSP